MDSESERREKGKGGGSGDGWLKHRLGIYEDERCGQKRRVTERHFGVYGGWYSSGEGEEAGIDGFGRVEG